MISFQGVSLQFGERKLFEDISFLVNAKDRIGLVGKNGAGKSTLLKAMVAEVNVDSGKIIVPKDITIGYLPQHLTTKDIRSVLEEAMSSFSDLHHLEREIEHLNLQLAERTDYETESYLQLAEMIFEKSERLHLINAATAEASAERTLLGLGFTSTDLSRPTLEFSGGWRMRIELAKILLKAPDIFLLDEPTNHLDIESIQWLENFLKQYHGAVVLISHDRTFLDAITTRTLEISLGKIYDYRVAYSKYVALRQERREQQMATFRNQQKQIEDTQDFIDRFRYKASKSIQVQSRIKQLEKMDVIEIDEEDLASLNIKFPSAPRSGTIVVGVKELTKRYGNHVVLNTIDLEVERGEKIAFVGKNGEGKSTLTRIIIGELDHEGICKLGHNVNIGYYAQNQDELAEPDKTVFETIDEVAVGEVRTKIRSILGAFLFGGEDVDKKVKVLSGGEKSRLALAKLLLEPYNLLVLDEPTNHLDMRSKDILKEALKSYNGTLIVVSHDREFLDGLTDKLYEFTGGKIKEYRCGIFEFLQKKQINSLDALNKKTISVGVVSQSKKDTDQRQQYLERKEIDKEIRKLINQVTNAETDIQLKESKLVLLDEQMKAGGSGFDEKLFKEYDELKKGLGSLMLTWERLQYELELLQDKRNSVN